MASASLAIRKARKRRDMRAMKKFLKAESGQIVRDDGQRLMNLVDQFIRDNP